MNFDNRENVLDLILSYLYTEYALGLLPVPRGELEALVEGALLLWPEIKEVLNLPVSRFPAYIREGREPVEGERIWAVSGQRGVPEKGHSGHPGASVLAKKGEKVGFPGNKVNLMELEIVREMGGKGKPESVGLRDSGGLTNGGPDSSKPLLNGRHEDFAVGMATGGKPQWQVYMEVYKCSRETAEDSAWRLMAEPDKFGIIRRFTYLREQVSKAKVLTAQEAREFLASAVRTPISEIDEYSPLAQEVTYEKRGSGDEAYEVKKVKTIGKLEALKLDADLGGYALAPVGNTPGLRLRVVATSAGIAAEMNGV